jgi:hypothetical protein
MQFQNHSKRDLRQVQSTPGKTRISTLIKAHKMSAISKRMEHVRKQVGNPSLKDFHRALVARRPGDEEPFRVSYAAVRNYHLYREPPVSYVARVAKVFGASIEWLATGEGEWNKPAADVPASRELMEAFEDAAADVLPGFRKVRPWARTMVFLAAHRIAVEWETHNSLRSSRAPGSASSKEDEMMAEATRRVARCIKSPLEVFEIDIEEFLARETDLQRREQYVISMCQALAQVHTPTPIQFRPAGKPKHR